MSGMMYLTPNAAGYKLYFNERDSDVSIKVEYDGEKCQFPAHKLILCTMSEVFRTMLDADMIEKSSKVITIRDSCPYAVKQFLKYLYTGIIDFNGWMEAVSVLKIAHKYSVQTLINLCETYLTANVLFNNACLLYELAKTFSLKILKKETTDFILQAGFIVTATEGFFNLRSRSLDFFLSSPLLNMENEGCVLSSLREWAVCECSRKCVPLTRLNVLAVMEPFLKHIFWNSIPEAHRTFIPNPLVGKHRSENRCERKNFHVPSSLQYHMNYIKFVVELGSYHENFYTEMQCLKFYVDSHVFLVGFRIVGLFHTDFNQATNPTYLVLKKDDGKVFVQFNMNSLSWTRGSMADRSVWREMIAYLPYPIRVDPFSTYMFSLKSNRSYKLAKNVKWPKTRLESEIITTHLGTIHICSFGHSYGITQLFVLPAPPNRSICCRGDND